ncbi:endonuclease NucS domain-containing protein [Glycomyces sp. NPDC047010]|uniref:endonuclease NucS domain-containing protein n=1 Tax=Glycomyces sp. NPDC047010 TaxID=3155023 RepID=UPI0033E67FAC
MLEKVLRDQLAVRLDLLEEGLRFVGTEERLIAAEDGSEGRADILASDRFGNTVVIEVKRSDGSSREAPHQVFKYAELLCRNKGLPPDSVRIMVVSTEWRELASSFSGYAELPAFDIRGYRLLLDEAGTQLVGAEPVRPKPPPRPVVPSDAHGVFILSPETDRERVWQRLCNQAKFYGIDHLLGFDFTARPGAPMDKHQLLYVVLGPIDPEDPRTANIDTELAEDGSEYRDREHQLQHAAIPLLLASVTGAVPGEPANPRILNNMLLDHTPWEFDKRVRRGGKFALHDLKGDALHWAAAASAGSGHHQQMFVGVADTSNKSAWEALRRKARMALGTNPDWRDLVDAALGKVQRDYPEADVSVEILNPTDLITVLVTSWPDKIDDHQPQIIINIASRDGRAYFVGGLLMATPGIANVQEEVRSVYASPLAWHIARSMDEVAEADMALLEALGLHYVLFEYRTEPRFHCLVHIIEDDLPTTRELPLGPEGHLPPPELVPLNDFLNANRGDIDGLVRQYRRSGWAGPQAQ